VRAERDAPGRGAPGDGCTRGVLRREDHRGRWPPVPAPARRP
jgi:hypothetical protein